MMSDQRSLLTSILRYTLLYLIVFIVENIVVMRRDNFFIGLLILDIKLFFFSCRMYYLSASFMFDISH